MLTIDRSLCGTLGDGRPVERFVLAGAGREFSTIGYGAIITGLTIADASGTRDNVVVGYDALAPYLSDAAYVGAVVGRYSNRIAEGRFMLDGKQHELSRNEGRHHLHGGHAGFSRRLWQGLAIEEPDAVGVTWSRVSPDGEEGYPGTLAAAVSYRLRQNGDITIDYEACTDAPTVVSLSQHTYFNLDPDAPDVLTHRLTLHGDGYLPVNPDLIPIGQVADVAETPFDFRTPRTVGSSLDSPHVQLGYGHGFDHTWAVRSWDRTLRDVAVLTDSGGTRTLTMATTEPGIQFYGGGQLDGTLSVRGRRLIPHAALCLEPQHYPNAPREPRFPSPVIRPDGCYRSTTRWRFTTAGTSCVTVRGPHQ